MKVTRFIDHDIGMMRERIMIVVAFRCILSKYQKNYCSRRLKQELSFKVLQLLFIFTLSFVTKRNKNK